MKKLLSNCPCDCMCLCVIIVPITAIGVYFLIPYVDFYKLSIFVCLFIIIALCICILSNNLRNEKKIQNIESYQKNIEANYKELLKLISRTSLHSSSIENNGLYKSLEMITETFRDKNCDNSKLKILKEIIDTIIKINEADWQIRTNNEQSQERNIKDTNSTSESGK